MSEKINYTCSLGSLCQTAEVLKRSKLKLCSYPFDWVFSDCNIILDCLENDFKKFLDKSYYIDVQHKFNERQCGHSFYHEDFFFHKNPRNEYDYEYYVRCVQRFRDLLSKNEKKLFIAMIVPDATQHPKSIYEIIQDDNVVLNVKNQFIEFDEKFKKYTKNYSFLVVFNLVKNENSYILNKENNLDFLELHTTSKSNGVKFIDEKDNVYLDEIINKHYKFELL